MSWQSIGRERSGASGLEVELDVGTPAWASVDPVDPGTRKVVSDGMRVLHDPDGLPAGLVEAVRRSA